MANPRKINDPDTSVTQSVTSAGLEEEQEYQRVVSNANKVLDRFLASSPIFSRTERLLEFKIDNFAEFIESNEPKSFGAALRLGWISWKVTCRPYYDCSGAWIDLHLNREIHSESGIASDLASTKDFDTQIEVSLINQIDLGCNYDYVLDESASPESPAQRLIRLKRMIFYSGICKMTPGFIHNNSLIFTVKVRKI